MQLIVDNLAVNYRMQGKGKPVLLIHGWGDSLTTYNDMSSGLAKKYQTVALDLPGFGGSQLPKEVWGLDEYCEFISHFLHKLEIIKPYAIIGHSNGGALAIRGLATGRLSADKLVLLAAAGVRNTHKLKKAATKAVAKTGKAAAFWLPNEQKQRLRLKLYGTIGSDMMVVPLLQETFKKTVSQDVQDDAAKLTLPTLLIFADNDPAIPLDDGKLYHSLIKGSKLAVLKGDDHFIHHDQKEMVERLVGEFLQ